MEVEKYRIEQIIHLLTLGDFTSEYLNKEAIIIAKELKEIL